MKKRHIFNLAAALMAGIFAMIPCKGAENQDADSALEYAISLYENGLYSQAKTLFTALQPSEDSRCYAYSLLCSMELDLPQYEDEYAWYKSFFTDSALSPLVDFKYAMKLYGRQQWEAAEAMLETVDTKLLPEDIRLQRRFYLACACFEEGHYDRAKELFDEILSQSPQSQFSDHCRYCAGYVSYERKDFARALEYFDALEAAEAFSAAASSYALECRFMLGQYDYVRENAEQVLSVSPLERRGRLARIASESFLLAGDAEGARKYYSLLSSDSLKSDSDYYYAASMFYALGDYTSAISNYRKISPSSSALYQQTLYNTAASYLKLKNKTAALPLYGQASSMEGDPALKKDALINYAKLAFDLNKDDSGFREFMEKYPSETENERFYSYMAIAALQGGDYGKAIEYYDRIDSLDGDQTSNYSKANYLRGCQLYKSKAFTACESFFKVSAYYGDGGEMGSYSQYLLANSYYYSGRYEDAVSRYTNLYNSQSLFPRPENGNLPYDIAYGYYMMQDYAASGKWFRHYVSLGRSDAPRYADALLRSADSYFLTSNYASAAAEYEKCIAAGASSLYPHYQAALSYGLLKGGAKKKLSTLEKAPINDPHDQYYSRILFELGRCYESGNQPTKAENTYNLLVSTAQDSLYKAKTLLQLGMLYRTRKMDDKALGCYKRIVESMPQSEYYDPALSGIESIYKSKNNPKAYYDYVERVQQTRIVDKQSAIFASCEQIFLSGNYSGAYSAFENFISDGEVSDSLAVRSNYFMGECSRRLSLSEKAVSHYVKVFDSSLAPDLKEDSALRYGELNFSLQNFPEAFRGYQWVNENSADPQRAFQALRGMAQSKYSASEYAAAIPLMEKVLASSPEDVKMSSCLAESYLKTSRREDAIATYKAVASRTDTDEGAAASVFLIQDVYDSGRFDEVKEMVYSFVDTGCENSYYLAKAYIILGDSFMELGDIRQAKATFESVLNGYDGSDDEISSEVRFRLQRLLDLQTK